MKDFGFLRTAAARPRVKPADVAGNVRSICELIDRAAADEVSLLVFPELCVTGYTCGDLFGQEFLLEAAEKGIREIISKSRGKDMTIVAGTPVAFRGRLYNCAAVIPQRQHQGPRPESPPSRLQRILRIKMVLLRSRLPVRENIRQRAFPLQRQGYCPGRLRR